MSDRRLASGEQPELDPALTKRNNLFIHVRNFLNDVKVKRIISFGTETFTAIQAFYEEPSPWSALKAVFQISKSAVDQLEIWPHDFFDEEGEWVEPFPKDFTGAILKVLKKFPHELLKTSNDGNVIHLVNLPEGKVGWLNNTKMASFKVDRIYAETPKVDEIKERIQRLLWEQFEGKPLVLRRNAAALRSFEDDRVVLEIDDAFNPLPSKLASDYSGYLRLAIDQGVNRSVMLYGPPGTGKSTMARTLVESLNLRSFRIRIEDVGGLDNATLFEAINIFKPDAIILDDFDRAGGQEQLLETMEHFQRHIKLVIATVNHRDNLDEALLRPGRFDELILVKRMDDAVVKNVLGEENLDIFDTVKDWPIAFIQEYVKRRRFMSKTAALKSITELAERVERLSQYEEDIGWGRVLKTPTKTKPRKAKKRKRDVDAKVQVMLLPNGETVPFVELEEDDDDEP